MGRGIPDPGGKILARCRELGAKIGEPARLVGSSSPAKTWSNATPTELDGIKFPSKLERVVYERLLAASVEEGYTLYRQVSLPLLAIAPRKYGIPFRFTPDFCLVYFDGRRRWIEAKGKRRSRDYDLRRAAAEHSWHIVVEEVES